MSQSVVQRSFSAGELSPSLAARADLVKYTLGLRTCRNFMVQKHGGVANRPGLAYIENCKTNTAGTFLFKYLADDPNESILIEAGNGYLRFYKDGAQVNISAPSAWSNVTAYTVGDLVSRLGVNYYCILAHTNQQPPNATYWYALTGTIYEIPTPFASGFRWHQSGQTITMTDAGVAPRELVYSTLTRWILRTITIAPGVSAPVTSAGTAGAAGSLTYRYKVTAASLDMSEESVASDVRTIASCAEPTSAAPNTIDWAVVTVGGVDVPEYYVYLDRHGNGDYGFIGKAVGSGTLGVMTFNDTGFTPDLAITPPVNQSLFGSSSNYPAVSATHQQRRFFANTTNVPDAIWASRVGNRSNFCISSPLQDDDSLTIRIAQNQNHPVRHMVPTAVGLVIFSPAGEHRLIAGDGSVGPLTPNSHQAQQDLYVGSNSTPPVVIGESILYQQARGKVVRDVHFEQTIDGLAGRDLTLLAGHLFERYTLGSMDYQMNDHSIVWIARSDGTLLGLTYIREQDILAWHRHDTYTAAGQSVIESVCVVPEDHEDVVYVLVARVINGSTVRMIERLESRVITTLATDAKFLDSHLSYAGAPTSSVSGLDHLEGQTVAALGDGVYLGTFTVASGAITLAASYSNIHVGLIIEADFETLDLDIAGTDIRNKKKLVKRVALLVQASGRDFQVGINTATLAQHTPGQAESPLTAEYTGVVELPLITNHESDGRVFLRHRYPLPLTILAAIPHVELGG
jgi:hypothetical protein